MVKIIPKDVKEVRALRYTLKLLQVFNNTLLNDDGDDEDNLPVSENNKDKSKGETISSDSEDSQKKMIILLTKWKIAINYSSSEKCFAY